MTTRKLLACLALGVAALGLIVGSAVAHRWPVTPPVAPPPKSGMSPSSRGNEPDAGAPAVAPREAGQSASDRISCGDIAGSSHGTAMQRLARAANLPDAAYTRYHEAVASAMCDGDSKTVNDLVDSGYLSFSEAKAMQDVIASDRRVHLSSERTAEGLRFEEAWKGLRELGLCSACAADVAGFYARQPASRCGALATRALDGDERALDELESEPAFCQPK